jgi:hypothetical protein
MPTDIKLKNSVTATNTPTSLQQGEVAINVTDRKVWVGNAATTPVQLLGAGATGSFSALSCTTLTATGVATFSAGTNSAPAITTTGDTNTGIFFPAADTIAFTEGGVESMRIDSSGNVGIGTSSVSSPSGFTKLVQIFDATGSALIASGGGVTAEFGCSSGGGWLNASGANPMRFAIDQNERMRIDSSGNVGIGKTTGITHKLEIQTTAGGLALNITDATASDFVVSPGVSSGVVRVGPSAGAMALYTSNAERMRIDTSGNLLVGRTSSSIYALLDVAGAIRVNNNTDKSANTNAQFGMFFAKGTTTVTGGAGATSIKSATGSEAAMYLVSGLQAASGKRFFDVVVTMGASLCTVLNSDGVNTPATRTYTSTSEILSLSLSGSDAYAIYVTGFGSNESS